MNEAAQSQTVKLIGKNVICTLSFHEKKIRVLLNKIETKLGFQKILSKN